jgi:hypothetical protein
MSGLWTFTIRTIKGCLIQLVPQIFLLPDVFFLRLHLFLPPLFIPFIMAEGFLRGRKGQGHSSKL